MPDLPDWSRYLPQSKRYALTDMGELAARLGSPVSFDRRGEVVWMWDGPNSYGQFTRETSGLGSSIAIVTDNLYYGNYAIELVGGSTLTQYAALFKYFMPSTIGKWGIEVAVCFRSLFDLFRVGLLRYTGTELIYAVTELDRTNNRIEIMKSDGSWQNLGSLPPPSISYNQYNFVKMVADFENLSYTRLLYNVYEYDLSSYPLRVIGQTSPEAQQLYIYHFSRAGQNDLCNIGRVIMTGNEP